MSTADECNWSFDVHVSPKYISKYMPKMLSFRPHYRTMSKSGQNDA